MANIDQYQFSSWNGRIPVAVAGYETYRRSGLDGLGVGFEAYTVDPAVITTRAIIATEKLSSTVNGYQALVQKTVSVTDGLGLTYRGVLVLQVRDIIWDQLIAPANSYLVTASWHLLRDVNA